LTALVDAFFLPNLYRVSDFSADKMSVLTVVFDLNGSNTVKKVGKTVFDKANYWNMRSSS